MKVLIIGAAGMIGRKLTQRLVHDGKLAGKAITHARLVDIVAPQAPANAPFPVAVDAFDIAAPYVAPKLVAPRPDVIFLLASVVSGEAEADFDKGYAINVGGTHAVFDAIRREQALDGAPTGHASSSPHRSPSSARLFPTRSATNSFPLH